MIAGALDQLPGPTGPGLAGPALSEALLRWLASWHPGPIHRYDTTGPVIEELAHDRWLRDRIEAGRRKGGERSGREESGREASGGEVGGGEGSGRQRGGNRAAETADAGPVQRSPGWLAATRALSSLYAPPGAAETPKGSEMPDVPGAYEPELLWLAEPTHLHVATDHLILLHGAADGLTGRDADALALSVAPMFDDAGLSFRRLDAQHWIVWPRPADPSASTASGQATGAAQSGDQGLSQPAQPSPATTASTSSPARRISVKVVGQASTRTPAAPVRPDATTTAASATAAQGHSVDLYLPRGPAGRTLRQVANAAQMAWHEHPVNLARLDHGLPALNSLWFTGPTTPADIASLRQRLTSGQIDVDDGPLLARLRDDREAWEQELAAALTRAAEDPDLGRLVLCGERGAREFTRRAASLDASVATAAQGAGLLTRLSRLGQRLAQRLTGAPAADPLPDPSTWFVEPASPDLKRHR